MKVGIICLERKAFLILFDDLKMTLTFKFFLHVKMSCKQIKMYFSLLTKSDVLRVIKNLSKNLLIQISMKKSGK